MLLIISSTNRPQSLTLELAKLYLDRIKVLQPQQPAELIDLCQLPSHFITSDLYGQRSLEFQIEEERVKQANYLVFVLPEYNGSLPGILKLWIDALTYGIFAGKKAALVGLAAGMFGNARGLDHLSAILNYLQVSVLPFRIHLARADQVYDPEIGFYQPEVTRQIDRQIGLLLDCNCLIEACL